MKNSQIENNLNVLNTLAHKHFPVKLSFAISVNIEELMKWHSQIEKQRIELLQRYSRKDENGDPILQDDHYQLEDEDGFMKDFQELLDLEVEPEIHKVSPDVFEQCDLQEKYDVPSVGELMALKFMIK